MLKDLLYRLSRSSKNPVAMSLTVRGILIGALPVVITLAEFACRAWAPSCFDTSILSPLVDAIVDITRSALELVAAACILWGVLRKIWSGRWAHPKAGL